MSDFQLDDYLDDNDNNGVYNDLLTLRKQLIDEKLVSVDIVKNLSTIERQTDDSSFLEKIDTILPAKTKFEFSYSVKNDVLFRSRIKRASLQTQLNPNKAEGSTNLVEPTVSINFKDFSHYKKINFLLRLKKFLRTQNGLPLLLGYFILIFLPVRLMLYA